MKFLSRISLFLFLLCPLASLARTPWTFLVYMAADNNLNPDADLNIEQMKQIGSSNEVTILVYLNIKRPGELKKTQKLLIKKGSVKQIGATTVEDSGSQETLIKALAWAIQESPSDYLAVGLWDHGSGPLNRVVHKHRGVCYDDTTGNYLTDWNYKNAFDVAMNKYLGHKKVDLVFFDACLMADLEVAYALQPHVRYMVASQETVPGPGYDYTKVLSLFSRQKVTPAELAFWMVTAYDEYYKPSAESYTLAAYDLDALSNVTRSLNMISNLLMNALDTNYSDRLWNTLFKCTQSPQCQHFTEQTYIDLRNFYINLAKIGTIDGLSSAQVSALRMLVKTSIGYMDQCIMRRASSKDLAKAQGMSIYFPDLSYGIEPSYYDLYWSKANPTWLNFLGYFAQPA